MSPFQKKNPFLLLPVQLLTPRHFVKYEILCVELKVPFYIFGDNELPDVMAILSTDEIERLKYNKNTFFVFDYTCEGTSYKEYLNFFNALEYNARKYNIPFYKIFFLSSNLADEKNYKDKNINVISFNRWDYFSSLINFPIRKNVDGVVDFLNLNRVIRYFRILTILKLVNSSIKSNLKISYDYLSLELLKTTAETHYNKTRNQIDYSLLKQLSESSPSVLDRSDFDINWASDMPESLFKSTLLSLVSETLEKSIEGTSIFYSEKTFKPMIFNHPICIFGQPNANKYLENLGYKTYEKYFDLSFDSIEDYSERLDAQVNSLELLNEQLLSMTSKQKLDWYMQGIDVIEHNKQTMKEQVFNKNKAGVFLELLKQYTS
jgi:hypothetical protein